jgi:ATP adenylyltransferase
VSRRSGLPSIWAPWRIPYLRKASAEDAPSRCFFCDYARAPGRDRKNLVVLRGRSCFGVLNRYPYTGGHVMVAPYAHKADLAALDAGERSELLELAVRLQDALRRTAKPHGFNLGINLGRAAGAGVPGHVHLHVVPRWNGDTNFMTPAAGVRVISQALAEVHAELQKALRRGR